MHWTRCLFLSALSATVVAAPPAQIPLKSQPSFQGHDSEQREKTRPLHGRFLHVTDFHPDRFYEIYSSTSKDSACHRGHGPAGLYGAETSECDSPIDLVNKTFEWIEKEFRDRVDFVVWTGDSARHDNDEDIPRSAEQVIGLNEFMVNKMYETFGKRDGDGRDENPNSDYLIPIIPTFGNNDILPHNVMTKGPNSWTRTYAQVWSQFIPEAQKHQFEQGGWFYVEAIPNQLAVFSLNTLYFFSSNAAADGCAIKSEPGYRQMEWLRIQLQYLRDRGMKAILTGHVPPVRQDSKTAWDETCWQKYTLWLRQYRDVIVTSLYGHFNYDHFMLQDFEDIEQDTEDGRMGNYQINQLSATDDDDDIHSAVSSNYFIELRDEWAKLPNPPKTMKPLEDDETDGRDVSISKKSKKDKKKDKKKEKKQRRKEKKYLRKIGGEYAERFAASFVSSSVVPNLYPTFRVFEYNTTGLEHAKDNAINILPPLNSDDAEFHEQKASTSKQKKYKFKIPDGPSKSTPPGPAYSPQTLSLIKYTQYVANITRINNDFLPPSSDADSDDEGEGEEKISVNPSRWNEGMHKGKTPPDKDHKPSPKKFKFDIHYDTHDDDVYQLPDLTMPNLMRLATRIGNFVPPKTALDATDDAGQVHALKDKSKKKHKGKKGKKGRKGKGDRDHTKENQAWYTFVERAYVGTKSRDEIEDVFG